MADPGNKYAIYFPAEGTVKIDPVIYAEELKLSGLDIDKCCWLEDKIAAVRLRWEAQHNVNWKGRIRLVNPENIPRIALLEKKQ